MLERYEMISDGKILPYFLQADRKDETLEYHLASEEELWEEHSGLLEDGIPPIELKNELAYRMLQHCEMCHHGCGVDRYRGETGVCGVFRKPNISSVFLHFGEENELVPSHTVFFAGCNFKCVFCQNYDISQHPERGIYMQPESLAEKLDHGGGRNVNWVGGDPTPNIPYILDVLEKMNKPLPQIWNSNMYLSKKSMELLAKLMDVYLTDFKYGNDRCAERLSGVGDYTTVVKRNHLYAERTGDLIIRHLVLPGHIQCCTKPLLEWINEHLESPKVNIMAQYRPVYKASQHDDISRGLSNSELKEIRRLRDEYGF